MNVGKELAEIVSIIESSLDGDYGKRIDQAFDNAMLNYHSYYSYPYYNGDDRGAAYKRWVEYASSHKEMLSDLAMHPLSSICLKIVQQS